MSAYHRRLDLLVAEKILGRKTQPAVGTDFVFDELPPWVRVPQYSLDVTSAWSVIEKLSSRDPQIIQWGEDDGTWTWYVDFEGTNDSDNPLRSRNIATAICLAALRAVGVEP